MAFSGDSETGDDEIKCKLLPSQFRAGYILVQFVVNFRFIGVN